MSGRENVLHSINKTELFTFNFIFKSFQRQSNKTECFMDSPCRSNGSGSFRPITKSAHIQIGP